MADQLSDFRIILDKINYGGKTVGSEWIFEFEFRINDSIASLIRKQAISRKVSVGDKQEKINRTLVQFFSNSENAAFSITGKVKANEEGSNEKYSESGSGTFTPLEISYNGTDTELRLLAGGIKVKEYKGPGFDPSKLNEAVLDFEFRVVIKGVSDNTCTDPAVKDPQITVYQDLRNTDIESLQQTGDFFAGATTPGTFDLKCCISKNEKNEFKAIITRAEGIIRWGIHTDRMQDPSVDGPNANITKCAMANEAIKNMEDIKNKKDPGTDQPWFPVVGAKAHELSHVEDYEKVYLDEFKKVKKDVEKLKPTLAPDASAETIKMMQDSLAVKYTEQWKQACITKLSNPDFKNNSENDAMKRALPILNRAIQRVKDFKKEKKCPS